MSSMLRSTGPNNMQGMWTKKPKTNNLHVTSCCFWILQLKAAIAVHSCCRWDMFPRYKSNNLVWKLLWNPTVKQLRVYRLKSAVKFFKFMILITFQTEKAKLMSGTLMRVSSSSIRTATGAEQKYYCSLTKMYLNITNNTYGASWQMYWQSVSISGNGCSLLRIRLLVCSLKTTWTGWGPKELHSFAGVCSPMLFHTMIILWRWGTPW